uniref:pilus assembly protein TadG-related protein n=2 Tax=Desulfobacula sp. TaxID=2593537 RepID=UPI002620A872
MKLKILIKYKARFKKMPLSILRNQNGVTAVLVAIVAAMLLGFTALAVDVGYMYSTRNELQNMADAAALAGAGELGRIYLALDSAIPEGFDVGVDDPDTEGTYRDRIEAVAENTAAQNKAAGITININEGDIDIGDWIWATSELIISNIKPDAVRVTVVRTSVATFFGKIFSFFGGSADTFQVSAVATAALSSPATVGPGELYVPFGISTNFFDKPPDPPEPCVTSIEFSPTMSSCAAWHNFFDPINANDLEEKLIGLIESYEPPEGPPLYGTLENIDGSAWLDKYFTIINTPEGVPTPATQAITAFDFQNGQIQSMFKTA